MCAWCGAWEQGQCLEKWFGFNGAVDHFGEKDESLTEYGVRSTEDFLGGPRPSVWEVAPIGLEPESLRAGAMWLDLISTRGVTWTTMVKRARSNATALPSQL